MNSRSAQHPEGLGASSGVLGRYLMDHLVSNVYFTLPQIPDAEGYALLGSAALLVPRWQNLEGAQASHLRGYGLWGGIQRLKFPGPLRKTGRVATGFLAAMGETLPHADNRMTLDPTLTDAWGLPAPHLSCAWTPNDLLLGEAMRRDAEQMVEAAGGVVTPLTQLLHSPLIGGFMKRMQDEWRLTTPGLFVHEVGGARMGRTPKDSVVNPWAQVWDSPNVFVTDGACWVSSGWANPTLTQMAITARACERAASELRQQNL
jgi:choline dehydrogenase-like flavoprotein